MEGLAELTPALRRTLLLLAVSCGMEALAYTVCVPFLTTSLRAERKTSLPTASLVFVSYTLGSVGVTPLVRPAIVACGGCSRATACALLVLALGQVLSVGARAPLALFCARFLAGMAGGLVWSSVLSACSVLAGGHGGMALMFGLVLSAVSVGTMAGPAIGGLLFRLGGWPLPFLSVGCAASAIALLVLELLEPLPLPAERTGGRAGAAERQASHLDPRGRAAALARARARAARAASSARGSALVLLSVGVGALAFSAIDSALPVHIEDTLGPRAEGDATLRTSLVFFLISVRKRTPRSAIQKPSSCPPKLTPPSPAVPARLGWARPTLPIVLLGVRSSAMEASRPPSAASRPPSAPRSQ